MCNLTKSTIKTGKKIVERKIRYDSTIVETDCKLLNINEQDIILFHKVLVPFTMKGAQYELTIPKDGYTLAYYWKEKPYNLYIWRDKNGSYLGSYFNIVKNTVIADTIVSFEDLVIDILILPNGEYFILDEDELPVSLNQFEDGFVHQALQTLTNSIKPLLHRTLLKSEKEFPHKDILSTLFLI
ncbi:DUF402 domain-containing protein [Priestia megaterium]